jgi:hypothetical protein
MDKKLAQRIHAKHRAQQRFGLTLNRHDLQRLVEQIQAGRARVIKRSSLRVSVLELAVDGVAIQVVYDHKRKNIVTFLPPKMKQG